MTVKPYKTIAHPSEGVYKEKGSKFFSFAYPVQDEAQIKEHLEHLKKKYFDARHHCFAWMLGPEMKQYRAFDDGEPNHSAGDPILGQIRSKNLTDILVVVVRYFGGTKLGVGGLITAYKTAAEDALLNAIIVDKDIMAELNLQFNYTATPQIMRLIKDFEMEVLQQDFTADCTINLRLKLKYKPKLQEKLSLLKMTGTEVVFNFGD